MTESYWGWVDWGPPFKGSHSSCGWQEWGTWWAERMLLVEATAMPKAQSWETSLLFGEQSEGRGRICRMCKKQIERHSPINWDFLTQVRTQGGHHRQCLKRWLIFQNAAAPQYPGTGFRTSSSWVVKLSNNLCTSPISFRSCRNFLSWLTQCDRYNIIVIILHCLWAGRKLLSTISLYFFSQWFQSLVGWVCECGSTDLESWL